MFSDVLSFVVKDWNWPTKLREISYRMESLEDYSLAPDIESDVGQEIEYEQPFLDIANKLSIGKGIKVLDIGAGSCFPSLYFSEKGCSTFSADISPDLILGADILYKFGPRFHRLLADGEWLPFKSEVFDLTFCRATLHHAVDMSRLLGEMSRVTKLSGTVLAAGETCRPFWVPERIARYALHRFYVEKGVNERSPTLTEYTDALSESGIRLVSIRRIGEYGRFVARKFRGLTVLSHIVRPVSGTRQFIPILGGSFSFQGTKICECGRKAQPVGNVEPARLRELKVTPETIQLSRRRLMLKWERVRSLYIKALRAPLQI